MTTQKQHDALVAQKKLFYRQHAIFQLGLGMAGLVAAGIMLLLPDPWMTIVTIVVTIVAFVINMIRLASTRFTVFDLLLPLGGAVAIFAFGWTAFGLVAGAYVGALCYPLTSALSCALATQFVD